MSTLADPWRSIAWSIRSLPAQFGLRQYSISIVTGTWSGDHVGDGDLEEQIVPILENDGTNPKFTWVGEEERLLNNLEVGAVKIGPITPNFGANGTPLSNLLPAVAGGEQVLALITGPRFPNGARFSVKKVDTSHMIHWMLTCEPVKIDV